VNFALKAPFFVCAAALLALIGLGSPPALAAAPTLSQISEDDLPKVVRAGQKVTLRLRFVDADGDRPRKAVFIDQSASASSGVTTAATRTSPDNPKDGVVLEWDINGFEQGQHKTRFEVIGSDGNTVRFPVNKEDFYEFTAESVVNKWITMGGGMVVGLVFVPFLVYVLARSINRRGDPSRAARIGLLFGILACLALFIFLFQSFYSPLILGIGIVAGLALLVLVLTRR